MKMRISETEMIVDEGKEWFNVTFKTRMSLEDFKILMDSQKHMETNMILIDKDQKRLEVEKNGSA